MSSSEWCTVESDPGVFSELIDMFGVKDVAVEEVYSLDSSEQKKEKCFGLVFLFKWKKELATDDREILDPSFIPELFFARQIVTNACATQAILSILLNIETAELGDELSQFKAFTGGLDAESKGIAIGNSDSIRIAHNSFARAEPFFHDDSQKIADPSGDAYHFVAYVPFRGGVYELDGLKQGPIILGDYNEAEGDWWKVAQPAIEERMGRYSQSETHFALMSVCEKKSSLLERELTSLLADSSEGMAVEGGASGDAGDSRAERIESLRLALAEENAKLEMQKAENVRRRHNFVPMIVELVKALAKKGAIDGLIDAAQKARSEGSSGSSK